jgi:hypothetical protein
MPDPDLIIDAGAFTWHVRPDGNLLDAAELAIGWDPVLGPAQCPRWGIPGDGTVIEHHWMSPNLAEHNADDQGNRNHAGVTSENSLMYSRRLLSSGRRGRRFKSGHPDPGQMGCDSETGAPLKCLLGNSWG